MKRTYKSPMVKKIDYTYDTQVVANSKPPLYCAMTAWTSETPGVCDNPKPWYDSSLHLSPDGV